MVAIVVPWRMNVTSRRLADSLLECGGVAGTAGAAFGEEGEGHVRFTLRVPVDVLPTVAAGIRHTLDTIGATAG